MRSGFVLRNATNAATYGTANLSITGRVTLPRWAAIAQGYLTESGAPAGDYNLPALNGYGPLVSTAAHPSIPTSPNTQRKGCNSALATNAPSLHFSRL